MTQQEYRRPRRPKVFPVLHLIGAGLIILGVVFVLMWVSAMAEALTNIFTGGGDGGGGYLLLSVLCFMGGVLCSGVANFLDSRAKAFIVARMPGP